MAYNTKNIVKDKDGNPISQYYNPDLDQYEPVEGSGGGNKVVLYNEDGTENNKLDLNPILDNLNRLTGTVLDEETRKANELGRKGNEDDRQRQEGHRVTAERDRVDVFGSQMDRVAEIERLVPENISNEISVLEDNILAHGLDISNFKIDVTTKVDNFKASVNTRVDGIDTRVDNIITSPENTINVEEIVDARHGEGSLGSNIQKIKEDSYAKDLQNEKTYSFGLQLSKDGQPQIIYKEVM